MSWQPIETAPKDGTVVRLRRVYKGGVIADGLGLFGYLHEQAPSRTGPGLDPLGRMSAADYAREDKDRIAWVATPKWLRVGGMFAFPSPTEWMPIP